MFQREIEKIFKLRDPTYGGFIMSVGDILKKIEDYESISELRESLINLAYGQNEKFSRLAKAVIRGLYSFRGGIPFSSHIADRYLSERGYEFNSAVFLKNNDTRIEYENDTTKDVEFYTSILENDYKNNTLDRVVAFGLNIQRGDEAVAFSDSLAFFVESKNKSKARFVFDFSLATIAVDGYREVDLKIEKVVVEHGQIFGIQDNFNYSPDRDISLKIPTSIFPPADDPFNEIVELSNLDSVMKIISTEQDGEAKGVLIQMLKGDKICLKTPTIAIAYSESNDTEIVFNVDKR